MTMLVVSSGGAAAPLVRRMHQDGHPVLMYIRDPFVRSTGYFRGLCLQADTWAQAMQAIRQPGSTVVFDDTGMGDLASQLGIATPTWGDSKLADELETDRGEAMRVLSSCGIRIPKTILFHPERGEQKFPGAEGPFQSIRGHVDEAVNMASGLSGKWMVKQYEGSSGSTFKADTQDELIDHLKDMPNHPGGDGPFILQQCTKGIEVSTEVWVSNGEIIPMTCNGTVETKRFYPGDLGPNTGSETSTLWGYGVAIPKILRETMGCKAFLDFLRHPVFNGISYPPFDGPLDVNSIISDDDGKPYVIEFTPRMGWTAYVALAELLDDGCLFDVFSAAARGCLSGLPIHRNYGYCVKCSVPPYPVGDEFKPHQKLGTFFRELMSLCKGVEIGGPVESQHLWLWDARMKGGKLELAGTSGEVGNCGGSGRTIEEARDAAHQLFDSLEVPNKQGRTIDGADMAIKNIGTLRSLGYETPEDRK